MLVPPTVAASTSPSPANVPPVIDTVAFVSVRLSGSDTASDGDTVTVCPLAKDTSVATLLRLGGSLPLVMDSVSVTVVLKLLDALPSLSAQVMVRLGNEPKFVGFSAPAANVTLSSTLW